MEQVFWSLISLLNESLLWFISKVSVIVSGTEAYFWSIGMMGVFLLLVSYLLVKISRKIPFGDYLLAFFIALSFVFTIILSLSFQEIQFSVVEARLTLLAYGFIGFLLLAGLVSGIIFFFYLLFRGISRFKERNRLTEKDREEI